MSDFTSSYCSILWHPLLHGFNLKVWCVHSLNKYTMWKLWTCDTRCFSLLSYLLSLEHPPPPCLQWPQAQHFTTISCRTRRWTHETCGQDLPTNCQRGAEVFNGSDDAKAEQQHSGCVFSAPVLLCLISPFTFSLPVCSPRLTVCFYPFPCKVRAIF